eukprot:495572-Lingulodinium_polyedra.AAC.1
MMESMIANYHTQPDVHAYVLPDRKASTQPSKKCKSKARVPGQTLGESTSMRIGSAKTRAIGAVLMPMP